MLPHFKSFSDLPHLIIVILLILGIGLGVYLAMQPQLFSKRADEGAIVDLRFIPESFKVEVGKDYEAKIAINPKAQRVTAAQLSVSYDPEIVSITEINNGGFLPVPLRILDDKQGNLNLIYGSTIESQATQPGMLSIIKFKILKPGSTAIQVKPTSEISISSQEGNVLSTYPSAAIEPLGRPAASGEVTRYPDNLLQEKAFFASSEPVVRDFTESLDPKPESKPGRVKPEFSGAFIKQLGTDIFISPIVALNEVLEEKAGELLGK